MMKKQLAVLILVIAEIFVLGHRSIADHQHQYTDPQEYSFLEDIPVQQCLASHSSSDDLVHQQDATSILRLERDHDVVPLDLNFSIVPWKYETLTFLFSAREISQPIVTDYAVPNSPYLSLELLRGPPLG